MDKNTCGKGVGYMTKGMAPGIEPDDDLWGCLVHPPQLQHVSYMAWEHTNLPHVDIQGELGGDPGVQQQQGPVQEAWGESWWEVIVRVPRQGEVDPATPPNRSRMYQEQHQRNAQRASQY
jgi:hypothetical protein